MIQLILREYLKNSDLERYKTTGSFPATQGPCLMCIRAEIAKALFHVRALERAFCPDTLLQDICNVVNVSTEYCLRDCIMSKPNRWEGLVQPVVLHTYNIYLPIQSGTVKGFTQRLPYPKESDHFLVKRGLSK